MRSLVHLFTGNPRKLAEWRRNFDRYGVEIRQAGGEPSAEAARDLLGKAGPGERVLAVCREESDLFERGSDRKAKRLDLELVDNVTHLTAWLVEDDEMKELRYEHRTPGYIDRGSGDEGEGGWWDGIFRLASTHKTYDEMRALGLKHSSRDMAISRFLLDRVYYKAPVDLRWAPQGQARAVDFSVSLPAFVSSSHYLQNPWAKRVGLSGLFDHVARSGAFFRAAQNRRQKNYWWPGLNAGVPFTPKRDAVHEITFLVHDLGHFLLPDPVFTGHGHADGRHRHAYVAYRMISEAVTLVLADMVFVDTLRRSGHDYDFSARKAYPLFEATGLDLSDPEGRLPALRSLLEANVAFCVRGDEKPWRALLARAGRGPEAFEAYRAKYTPFFVEDFRWTDRNFGHLASRGDELARFWALTEPVRKGFDLDLESLDELLSRASARPGHDLVARLFDLVWHEKLLPALEPPAAPIDEARALERAFARYLAGQMGLFARYHFVPEAHLFAERLTRFVLSHRGRLGLAEIDRARAFYEEMLSLLVSRSLLTLDDAATFREVFPLFEPYYVFYDGPPDAYEPLAEVAKRILG